MSHTTLPTAKANLMTLLDAATWPGEHPEIRWGQPTEREDIPPSMQLVYFGETVVTKERRGPSCNPGETYPLRVIVDVRQWGDNERETEERAWELVDVIEETLAENYNLNGAISHWSGFTATQVNQPQEQQWRSMIAVAVNCSAYPQP